MANHTDSLIPLDINANENEVDVTYHSPKERGPEIRNSDENDVVPTPHNGMIFGSEDEVRSYYTKYANQVGFGVMTRTSRKVADGKIGYFILACSREGFRRNSRRNPIRSVPSRKQKCEARINVSLCKDGFYRIQTVTLNHNHELSPGQVKLNVDIDTRAKRKLDPEDQTEEQMNKSFRSLVVGNGVYDNVRLCPNDCGNYIRSGGRLIGVDGDGQYADYKLLSCRLKTAIYDALAPNEFEMNWKTTMKEFGLEDNEWLNELCLERHRWAPIFVKSEFWAGMSTIRYGEIMHSFFDGFVGCQTTLKQFLDAYDNALQARAEKEFEADFRSFCITLTCATKSPFERQFQTAYTHAKFLEVQREFVGKADCNMVVVHDEGSVCRYNVIEDVMVEGKPKDVSYGVIFDRVNCDVKCACHMFEFIGIICRHSLAVLSQERVKEIPCKYVLDRWRSNLKRRHVYVRTSYTVRQLKPRMERFDLLCKQFDSVAEIAAEFEETSAFVSNTLCDLKEKLEAWASHMRNTPEAAAPISCAINGAS
ncbi:hypothetical protein K1719_008701 [Acacia pycnantha]|nr:hypothetical protein K1719_008701 [Acacia pycnantha]